MSWMYRRGVVALWVLAGFSLACGDEDASGKSDESTVSTSTETSSKDKKEKSKKKSKKSGKKKDKDESDGGDEAEAEAGGAPEVEAGGAPEAEAEAGSDVLEEETSVEAYTPSLLNSLYTEQQPNFVEGGEYAYPATFDFLGWSADGRYYAFRVFSSCCGMRDCEGDVEFAIVDAENDKYVKGSSVKKSNGEGPTGCKFDSMIEAVSYEQNEQMAKHNIKMGHLTNPVPVKPIQDSPGQYSVSLPDGSTPTIQFQTSQQGDRATMPKASYQLAWAEPEWKTIEGGKRARDYVLDYRLEKVFLSPNGRHAAVLVGKVVMAIEGDEYTYMTNGTLIPGR